MNQRTTKQSTTELFDELKSRLDRIEGHMPNGELAIILKYVEMMMDKQEKMHADLSDMKKTLLNPEDGVIVRVNKNTEFRREWESKEQKIFNLIEEHNDLMSFKSNITKTLWIILSSIAGSIVLLWQKIIGS